MIEMCVSLALHCTAASHQCSEFAYVFSDTGLNIVIYRKRSIKALKELKAAAALT